MSKVKSRRDFLRAGIAAAATAGAFLGSGVTAMARPIDIRDTEPAREAARLLKSVAQGNEGDGGWESLVLDPERRTVEGTAFVKCRHVWGRGRFKTVAYSWTVKAHVKLDLRDGRSDATIDFGRGIKVKARDLIAILAAL